MGNKLDNKSSLAVFPMFKFFSHLKRLTFFQALNQHYFLIYQSNVEYFSNNNIENSGGVLKRQVLEYIIFPIYIGKVFGRIAKAFRNPELKWQEIFLSNFHPEKYLTFVNCTSKVGRIIT